MQFFGISLWAFSHVCACIERELQHVGVLALSKLALSDTYLRQLSDGIVDQRTGLDPLIYRSVALIESMRKWIRHIVIWHQIATVVAVVRWPPRCLGIELDKKRLIVVLSYYVVGKFFVIG